ncbi:MAG TPA: hypothetical protein VKV27_00620 [Solirubrobacteraceae bacterium]|nr:hypothetical protein [Solirubrobacteraceae bacterium]
MSHRRRLPYVACALLSAVALAACGHKSSHPTVADANNDGAYVDAGPVTYQLQISRALNQYDAEDSQYVRGLPAGMSPNLPPTEMWFGVFLWAKNQTNRPQTTSDNFEVVDSSGDVYRPVHLNPALNPFAWTAQTLPPQQTEPSPSSIAAYGPTQGGLLLFRVSTDVYANRPLTLYILSPSNRRLASISLNL